MNSKVQTPQGPTGKIISVQVTPVIHRKDNDVTFQLGGVTEETNGFGIYIRRENGQAEWFADVSMLAPAVAIEFAELLALKHRVEVEQNAFVDSYEIRKALGSVVSIKLKK